MALSALNPQYCVQGDIEALLSVNGLMLGMNDSETGGISPTELGYLTNQGINYATARINDYCAGRYDQDQLATSWTINDFATVLAARWVRLRRGNPVPSSLDELYKEVMENLKEVKRGAYSLEDLQERVSGAPLWSNIRVTLHDLRRVRVEMPISEQTPYRVAPVQDQTANYLGPEW